MDIRKPEVFKTRTIDYQGIYEFKREEKQI